MTTPTLLNENGSIIVKVPMSLKRKNGRKQVIIPNGLIGSNLSKPLQQEALHRCVVPEVTFAAQCRRSFPAPRSYYATR